MLESSTPLAEIVVRVVVIYVALSVFIRAAGKREIGQLAPLDLLAMLLLSETVSPALTAQDTSLVGALVAAATLLTLTVLVGRLTYRSRTLERWIDGTPIVLVEQGRPREDAMRQERITPQELETALRRNGLRSIDEVELAVVEPQGEITIIRKG